MTFLVLQIDIPIIKDVNVAIDAFTDDDYRSEGEIPLDFWSWGKHDFTAVISHKNDEIYTSPTIQLEVTWVNNNHPVFECQIEAGASNPCEIRNSLKLAAKTSLELAGVPSSARQRFNAAHDTARHRRVVLKPPRPVATKTSRRPDSKSPVAVAPCLPPASHHPSLDSYWPRRIHDKSDAMPRNPTLRHRSSQKKHGRISLR